jgi:hypothetical protein
VLHVRRRLPLRRSLEGPLRLAGSDDSSRRYPDRPNGTPVAIWRDGAWEKTVIVGCYVLDLYCDDPNCPDQRFHTTPSQFTDETGSGARAEARRAGWRLNLDDGTALCPKCVKRHGLARSQKSA